VAATRHLVARGAPVVPPSDEHPHPERLAACRMLRDLRVALCLTGFDDVFGVTDNWAEALRWFVDGIRRRTPP